MPERPRKPVRSTTLERLRWTVEADRRVAGLPQPRQLGDGLRFLLEHIAVPVAADDLLVGRILEEVPDAEGEALLQATVEGWRGRAIPPWMPDGGHECFAWDRLLAMGLPGLEEFARAETARRARAGAPAGELDFLRGAADVYGAFRTYARRYADAARRAGLEPAARACQAAAERAPDGFAEALQLVWLVGHVYCTMVAVNPTLTFGRLDLLLADRYRRDLGAGRLTRPQAGDLIADFYLKNELILGRGEHQMSGGSEHDTGWHRNLTYDAPQYVVLGGRSPEGVPPCEDLTALFLERIDPGYENPVVVFRYCRGLPPETWRLACARMRDNASFMVYNDENIIPAMVRSGIATADAVGYTMHGCNWPDVPGIQRAITGLQSELPRHLLEALTQADGQALSIDALYDRFAAGFAREIDQACESLRNQRRQWAAEAPGWLRVDDCFLDGPIGRARSWEKGGVRYPTLTCALTGLATAADGLAAVEELLARTGKVSLLQLRQALAADYAGHEPLRLRCLSAPKFGQDDERADAHAVRLLERLLDQVERAARPRAEDGVVVFCCLESDMRHIGIGAGLGATPDGRRAGQPISENTSPYPGSSRRGLTATLRSLAKLPFDRIHSGALNLRLPPALVAGEDGLTRLAAVLGTYFELGGLQVQLSIVDAQTLREAQRHPEQHRDLMVRITGYSAVFVDMAPQAQEELIRREEVASL